MINTKSKYLHGVKNIMVNGTLAEIGLGAFLEEILVGIGNGLVALAPGLAVLIIVGAAATGIGILFRNVFNKTK